MYDVVLTESAFDGPVKRFFKENFRKLEKALSRTMEKILFTKREIFFNRLKRFGIHSKNGGVTFIKVLEKILKLFFDGGIKIARGFLTFVDYVMIRVIGLYLLVLTTIFVLLNNTVVTIGGFLATIGGMLFMTAKLMLEGLGKIFENVPALGTIMKNMAGVFDTIVKKIGEKYSDTADYLNATMDGAKEKAEQVAGGIFGGIRNFFKTGSFKAKAASEDDMPDETLDGTGMGDVSITQTLKDVFWTYPSDFFKKSIEYLNGLIRKG